jgi:hypothetical protein
VAVRRFYDFLVEEGVRESNPVGRGCPTPAKRPGQCNGADVIYSGAAALSKKIDTALAGPAGLTYFTFRAAGARA